uniref:DM2 domain-containing protein n=1 Tax=Chaetoceros debilis TaxID=122233 RepID=A0A7S3V4K7_9STRA|mmetsp:Transcript_4385/g.6405  ORF Transcript_4385/g.6405 Transcript_4385/m.6405 type:complete len:319 (-) Transcript_4385:1084-2040(-)|eukprot:CAMPEP_0194097888 /NCGR_PEP_ID=MMETSP0149-20130528/58094_1 /TAXON_ID=122233 /ORGANISM="Chaetoceros debilis, Strain MM31A-1" /LENGTH=318 /DNA_ID=CAMNT_0038783917 /DNA_START=244 /DNA_END=1200 /DNA_ORIENTATION=-
MGDALPEDADIRKEMEKLVQNIDIESITTKQFIKMLSKAMGVDLKQKKKYIKGALTEVLDAMENDSDEEEAETKPKKRGGGGLTAVKEISPEMAEFLGMGDKMARTEVVKALWAYIKKNDLQNPNDKREILLDAKMKELFHADKITMFTMNKYVSAHVHPFKAVNLNEPSENSKRKKEQNARKRKAAKDAKNEKAKKRKPSNQPPWRLSQDLIAVVQKEILSRPQVTKALWVYIKENDLQNPEDKREILCDEMLKKVMGDNDRVTMFSMNKHITQHLVEKVVKIEVEPEKKERDQSEGEEQEEDEDGTESEGSDEESD